MANTIKIGNIEASSVMIGNSAVSAVYIGSSKIYPSGGTVDYSKQYLTFEVVDGGNITITASIADAAKTIQYSTDNGSTWTSLTTSTTAQELGGTLNVGDKVLVKGTNTTYGTNSNYNTFGGTAKVNVYGNIMSLISGDSFENNKTLTDSYTFNRLFNLYTNLLSAENLILPATTLANWCYYNMFQGCRSLTTAPELPATTLAAACYQYMFNGCTSLETAPELPATTLATACYASMFRGCTKLNYIKCLATDISATSCTSNWVANVGSTGTFVKNASMTSWTTGNNGIPTGWTVVTE